MTKHASELLNFYPDDLEPMIVDGCLHLEPFLVQNTDEGTKKHDIHAVDIYPNTDIAIKIVFYRAYHKIHERNILLRPLSDE